MPSSPKLSDNFEIEVKFEAASQRDLDRLEAFFRAMKGKPHGEKNYQTTLRYYDTPGYDLQAANVYLRTLDACPPYFPPYIDIKTKGYQSAGGTIVRQEFSFMQKNPVPDLAAVTDPQAKALLKPAEGKRLTEIFNTVTRRQEVCLTLKIEGREAAVELALDEVTFVEARTGSTLRQAYEIEIEFKAAYSDPAFTEQEAVKVIDNITRVFKAQAALSPLHESRAETGFRLIREKYRRPQGPDAGKI